MIRISPGSRHRAWGSPKLRFFFQALRENRSMVLFSIILICGIIFGTLFARNAGEPALNKLDFIFFSNFKERASQSLVAVFSASFASSFLFILFCFLCGLSMWGMFIIPVIVFFRGFGLGLTSGYIYAYYAWKGVLFNLSVILPGAFVCCIAILLAAREGTKLSKRIAACGTSAQSGTINRNNIRLYLLRFGAILMIAFLAALIDLLLSASFAGLFGF
ncbi:MAG TPA: stage II sporulation protein M [Caproiciproducens sp.]|nr:stage II sporulation protein M [Caproiciproducens sp.]